jgi:hypothetical protein
MIEDEKLGLKIAENPRDKLIHETIEHTTSSILETEMNLEIKKVVLEYLKTLK